MIRDKLLIITKVFPELPLIGAIPVNLYSSEHVLKSSNAIEKKSNTSLSSAIRKPYT